MPRPLLPQELENYKPLRELVFDALRQAILSGSLRPGERLMEIQLAEQMGVSRTPIREAIRKLELEGLVVMVPRKAAYVADMTVKDIHEVFEIRAALERLAVELATQRIQPAEVAELGRVLDQMQTALQNGEWAVSAQLEAEFHELLFAACRNARLHQLIRNQREQLQRFRPWMLSVPGRLQAALHEHRSLWEALRRGDVPTAGHWAQEHVRQAENTLLEQMRQRATMAPEPAELQGGTGSQG
ncbi:MAG: GntR family transcriptional regulator [Limnochordaceae bacterium]|nr:GntR family transcriptional regulator [Limnochordaceae bacterium]